MTEVLICMALVLVWSFRRQTQPSAPPEGYHALLDCPRCFGNRMMSDGAGRRCEDCDFFRAKIELDGLDDVFESERVPSWP